MCNVGYFDKLKVFERNADCVYMQSLVTLRQSFQFFERHAHAVTEQQ